MADDNVNVSFGATIDGAIAGINTITKALEGFGANIEGLGGPLAAVGEAAAAAFAFDKIAEWTEHVVDAGVDLAKLEAQTGLTAQQANVLAFAAEDSDSQLQLLSRTMGQFAKTAEESQGKTSGASQAFKAMGIDVQGLLAQGKDMNDIFNLTVQKLATYKDSLNKTAVESLVMGGRSSQLALALKELGTNYAEMDEAVKRSGVTIAGFDDAARNTKAGMVELHLANQGFSNGLFMIFKPAIDAAILGFRGFVEGVNESLKYGGALWGILEGVSGVFLGLETVVIGFADAIKVVFQILIADINAVLGMVTTTTTVMSDVIHGNFSKIGQDIKNGNAQVKSDWTSSMQHIKGSTHETLEKLGADWKTYFKDVTEDAKQSAKDQGADAPKIAPDPTAAMNADIEAHKKMLDEEVALVGDNLQARMILYQQYYDWLKGKYPQDANALADAGRKIAQDQDQEVKKSAASWNSFFNSFNGSIMGMLRGSDTLKQGFYKALDGIVEYGLKAVEKLAANWIAGEIQKTAATNAGNAARIASDTAGAAASKTAQAALDRTSINKSASTAAAGAYSSTAAIPIIGPILAPGAAALAFGAVEAFGSFETGTPYVPKTGPYILHQGEEVRPANVGGGSGGSPDVHFHVNAMDSQSVQQFFNTHGDKIASAVIDQYKRGNAAFRYPR